jgi:hypothetical protein
MASSTTTGPTFSDLVGSFFSLTSIVEFFSISILWCTLTFWFYADYGNVASTYQVHVSTCMEASAHCDINSQIEKDVMIVATGPTYVADYSSQDVEINVRNETDLEQTIPVTIHYQADNEDPSSTINFKVVDDSGKEHIQDTFIFHLSPHSSMSQIGHLSISAKEGDTFTGHLFVAGTEKKTERKLFTTFSRTLALKSLLALILLVPPGSNVVLLIVSVLMVKIVIDMFPSVWKALMPNNMITLVAFGLCLVLLIKTADAAYLFLPLGGIMVNLTFYPLVKYKIPLWDAPNKIIEWVKQKFNKFMQNPVRKLLRWVFVDRQPKP